MKMHGCPTGIHVQADSSEYSSAADSKLALHAEVPWHGKHQSSCVSLCMARSHLPMLYECAEQGRTWRLSKMHAGTFQAHAGFVTSGTTLQRARGFETLEGLYGDACSLRVCAART